MVVSHVIGNIVNSNKGLCIPLCMIWMLGVVALTPARRLITEAIPKNFKIAVGAGIGLFIAFVGLKNAGIVVTNPATITGIGDFGNPLVILSVVLILLGLILHFAKVPAPIIITMVIGAILVVILCTTGVVVPYANGQVADNFGLLGSYNSFSTFTDVAKAG